MQTPIECRTCGRGTLLRRRVYRMSIPVVVIGWLIVTPSIIAMVIFGLAIFGVGASVVTQAPRDHRNVMNPMVSAGVHGDVISAVLAHQPTDAPFEVGGLSEKHKAAVMEAFAALEHNRQIDNNRKTDATTTAVAGVGATCMFVGSMVSGLLGWLLVMKKRILA